MTIKQLQANNALLNRALGLAIQRIVNLEVCGDIRCGTVTCGTERCLEYAKAHFIAKARAKGEKS